MNRLLTSLSLGAAAGVVDVIPMLALDTSLAAKISALLHWVVLGFVITYVRLDVAGWLKGLTIGIASALPVIALLVDTEPASVAPVIIMSALLGAGVGWVAGRTAVLRGRGVPSPVDGLTGRG